MRKILLCSEAHYLNTGYGVFYSHLLNALHNSGKYEVAEFAAFGHISHPQARNCPWKFYANGVDNNDPRYQSYKSHPSNKFGAWRFERVLLDFKPEIVISIRDVHMDSFIMDSPLAPYVYKIISPTIDSVPQLDEWIDIYSRADAIFSHTKWGLDQFKKMLPNSNVVDVLGCGVDLDVFKPMSKGEIRREFSMTDDMLIFGTVMRNQKRKLFPNLINGFVKYINDINPDIAKRSYLYLHTSYPDKRGWNLQKLIKESGVGSKIIFSYICKYCNHIFASVYQDARTICPKCNQIGAVHPSVSTGLSRQQLAKVYNLFDLYFQVASCEGFGMPVIEAGACGVPVASMDFGAMGEVADNIGAIKIKPAAIFRDYEHDAYRCIADEEDIARIMSEFALGKLQETTKDPIEEIIKRYSWSDIYEKLTKYIDSIPEVNRWNEPFELYNIPNDYPKQLSNPDFMTWIAENVFRKPEMENSYLLKEVAKDLHYGLVIKDSEVEPMDQQKVFEYCKSLAIKKLFFEQMRLGHIPLRKEDYLEFANNE
jgi:glycosyltransferase involved in cell wall biosynthesis